MNLDRVREYLLETSRTAARTAESCGEEILGATAAIVESLRAGGKILLCGNGGSAGDAQHLATEFVSTLTLERRRDAIPAIALTTDTSMLTAVANDFGFELVFARQVEALGRQGDVAFGISTSGRSPNVLAGLTTARERGLRTLALTGGDGGAIGKAADTHLNVASDSTARVQEVHRTLLHAICDLVERGLFA